MQYWVRIRYFTVIRHQQLKVYYHIVFQASVLRHLQLKHQNLGVGSCTEEVLQWLNYPCASAHYESIISCQGMPNQPASSLRLCFTVSKQG